jgi:hypothetical protein
MLAFLPKTLIMPIFREIEEGRVGKMPFLALCMPAALAGSFETLFLLME